MAEETVVYKVLVARKGRLYSTGLRNAPIEEYGLNKWKYPEHHDRRKKDSGGLWVAKRLYSAKNLKKYLKDRYCTDSRIFKALIGRRLDGSPYRIKTDKLMLLEEILD